MPGIRTGSLNPNMKDKREKSGFGFNAATGMDVAGLVLDVVSQNYAAAAMDVVGLADGASGGKLLSDEMEMGLEAAQAVSGLGSLVKGAGKTVAKEAVKGAAGSAADIASKGGMIKGLFTGASDAAPIMGALDKAADVADAGATAAKTGGVLGNLGDLMKSVDQGDAIGAAMDPKNMEMISKAASALGGDANQMSFADIMKKMGNMGNKGLDYAGDAAELMEMYHTATAGPAPPGMKGGGGGGGQFQTVASQMMRR